MITVENLSKDYGKTTAVSNLSFSIRPGAVTGFLGPNGSGKSTTMRCIVGLDNPTTGRATIDGVDYNKLKAPITKVGALLDGKAFHPKRTAEQHLSIVAATHGIPRKQVDRVLDLTGISNVKKKKLGGFSLGMGQRLGIATALLGDPEVLILDEPVNGLDPDGVRWVRGLMRQLADQGRTILVSSHLMSEMALTADDLVIIGKGKLIDQGPMSKFTESSERSSIKVAGPDIQAIVAALHGAQLNTTMNAPDERHPQGSVTLHGISRADVGRIMHLNDIELHELSESFSSLEDVFMELTGEQVEYRVPSTNSQNGAN